MQKPFAAPSFGLMTVPSGAMSVTGRKMPSFLGISSGIILERAMNTHDHVLAIGLFTNPLA